MYMGNALCALDGFRGMFCSERGRGCVTGWVCVLLCA
eukprot:SAG11_NODE_39968_length_215_cov_172.715517_1_plen_36_part_01